MDDAQHPIAHIVIGFDFSDSATHSVATALWIAKKLGSELHVGTATSGHLDPEAAQVIADEGQRRPTAAGGSLLEAVETQIRERIETLGLDKIPVTYHANSERPYGLLTRLAADTNADLIVVGASGLGAVKRWLVGSTADKLVRGADLPVLVVKAHCLIRTILCAVDFSDESAAALRSAKVLAEAFDAVLHTINVVEVPKDLEYDLYGSFWTEDYRNKLIQREEKAYYAFLDDTVGPDAVTERHTAVGVADDMICDAAQEIGADLLVVGSHGRHGLSGVVIGNTANRVLHQLPCSLLTVKGDGFGIT